MFNVTISALLETRVLLKPMESEDVSKYAVICKVCTGRKFSVKISWNFPEEISENFQTQPYQGRSDGGYIGIYTPTKISPSKFL